MLSRMLEPETEIEKIASEADITPCDAMVVKCGSVNSIFFFYMP